MARGIVVLAERFRQEPLDALGYDQAQDGEGLLDASDACKAAWREFGPVWRAARKADLAREPQRSTAWLDSLTPRERWASERVREVGAVLGRCSRRSAKRPTMERWRQVMDWTGRLRVCPEVGEAIWPLVDGAPLETVAVSLDVEPERLGRQCARALRWLYR